MDKEQFEQEVQRLTEENSALKARLDEIDKMLPADDHGDQAQQARAWNMVYQTCVELGLLSFLDRLSDNGAIRTVKFIRHLHNRANTATGGKP